MYKKLLIKRFKIVLLALVILAVMVGTSSAAVFNLRAEATLKPMPDGTSVIVWGFAQDAVPVTVPGPMLIVPHGDTSLTINLTNNLAVPVSIVIPGQLISNPTPTYADGRVMSFTTETPANGGLMTYTWNTIKPGTYMYLSGTNPAVQVQMGLYGAVTVDAAAGQAYSGVPYTNEVVLFFSEIDSTLHAAIDAAVAGGLWGTASFPSTINYDNDLKYFLINGEPYSTIAPPPPLPAGNINEQTLIRFLNAGLQTHVPVLQGAYMKVIAEDGNLSAFAKAQYSLILSAGKTADAIFNPTSPGTYPLYDRRLNLTNGPGSSGGMLRYLSVATPPAAPVAADDAYTTAEDTSLLADGVTIPGVLGNDTGSGTLSAILVSGPTSGSLTCPSTALPGLCADGTFTYAPNPNYNGTDIFTYKANDGILDSNVATVRITVAPVNDAPVSNPDAYTATATIALNVAAPGVLGNDTDADGNPLTAVLASGPTNGGILTLNPDGSFTYTYPTNLAAPVIDTFAYYANDGSVNSTSPATVTITVNPWVNKPPVAVDDFATTVKNTPVTIAILANDYDPDGTIDPATITIVTRPKRGTVTINANGTVTYTPNLNFRGTDPFTYTVRDNNGATSNVAKVTVNVTR